MRKQLKERAGNPYSDHNQLYFSIGSALEWSGLKMDDNHCPVYGQSDWLPLDGFLKEMKSRKRVPKVRDYENKNDHIAILLRTMGLHKTVRLHLAIAFQRVASADPELRQSSIDDASSFFEESLTLKQEIFNFVKTQKGEMGWFSTFCEGKTREEKSSRFSMALELDSALRVVLEVLTEMDRWALEKYDKLNPPQGGKPRIEWRHEFVTCLAHTWWIITDRKPPVGPESLFIEFLENCWLSGGEDLPEINWEATVRTVVAKSKTDNS